MLFSLTKRLVTEVDPRILAKLAWNSGVKGAYAIHAFERRVKQGRYFPAFLFISLTNNCNLRCQGCWVTPSSPPQELDPETVDRIIATSKKNGTSFFGLLGGEPLLYKPLFSMLEKHADSYFQIFTNGTGLTREVTDTMRRTGNVTPLISIEGNETVSDERRGGRNVYVNALNAVENCRRSRLFTGVATSVCKSNIDDLVSERFLDELIERGVHYMWYYIYRPVGPSPAPELALDEEDIVRLRRFMVEMRRHKPIMIIDAYWNHRGEALCPAVTGISHHVSPSGFIEPCPPVQFARENLHDTDDLQALVESSEFLAAFRREIAEKTQGCILLDNPQFLHRLARDHGAHDTSGRGTGFDELAAMHPVAGHHLPGREIPEKSWVYRFAKKHWFFGFGAYG